MVFVSVGQMLRWALMNEAGRWRPAVARWQSLLPGYRRDARWLKEPVIAGRIAGDAPVASSG